jgi:uncharacterized protein YqeY
MMSIKAQLQNQLKDAMRARDKQQTETLRLITAAIKQIEVDERIEVDDARMLLILDKLAKQRNESITQFKAAGRQDLVDQEQYELAVIAKFLPEPLSESEVIAIIEAGFAETGAHTAADMGKVMAFVKPKVQGRADMGKVSQLIKSKLA